MRKMLGAMLLTTAVSGCGLGASTSSPSPARLDPTAICGPKPELVQGERVIELAALEGWMEARVAAEMPQRLDLFREIYLRDPNRRRRQIEACHRALSAP